MRLVSVTTAHLRSAMPAEGRRIRPQNGDSSLVLSKSHNADGIFRTDKRGGNGVLILGKSSVTRPRGSGLVLLILRNWSRCISTESAINAFTGTGKSCRFAAASA